MARECYLSVMGKKQGQFKSESTLPGRKAKWIPALGFEMALESPRDPQSGLPTGKRHYAPVRIVKEWGAASPQALAAAATNETLTEIVIEFVRADAQGKDRVFQTVTLTNASIARIARVKGRLARLEEVPAGGTAGEHSGTTDPHEWEEWAFRFQKIQLDDHDGHTSFADDWEQSIV